MHLSIHSHRYPSFLNVSSRPVRNISSQALSLHAVLCPSGHGQAVVEKQLFENYRWPVTQSPTFQTSCFGNHVAWSWEGQTCSSHVEGSESKEDGNLFPCLNVFRPLLATSGSERWGFWLKGWNPTCPPHFIVGMLGRLVRSCLWSSWLECAHVVQRELC